MKKTTYVNTGLIALFFFLSVNMFSQNLVPFSPRYDQAIKGDMLLIGNSNVGIHATNPYNGTNTNDRLDAAVHVDIDGDPSTFNSSSADLDVPNNVNCYQIVYAGLYWSSVVNGSDPIADVKFRVPGGSYVDITGTEIYYQNAATNSSSNTFAYYHDVTDMLTALPNPEGTYTVANISSLVGAKPNSEGLSAGWSLFVIYEDPQLPSKYITSFDGFTRITGSVNATFPVSGFTTIPTGPVRAKFAFSTIEGDRRWTGDYLRLNGTTIDATNNAGTVIRPGNNFFNSSVSIIDPVTNTPEIFTDRNPAGSNTLGFDAGIINVPNAGNTLIPNGATSASISLGSGGDIYYYYFSAFAIEIIAPNIVLTKIVEDEFGNDISNQLVNLGDELNYVIGFQNNGNDDATNLTIRDILPINVVFNYPGDLALLPSGVTVQSYNPATREIVFAVDNSVVEENDPLQEIRFKVTVVQTCSLLNDACDNIISNQAFSTYNGTLNPTFTISDDPSYNTNAGCLLNPAATNFLADIDCTFTEEVILCGASTVLTAGDGYDQYSWSTSPTGSPVIGTTQSITVTTVGTYYVRNTAIAPCQSINQEFEVITFGAGVTNPLIPFADQVVICPNDGKELPNFFLCGTGDFRDIQTNITDTSSIIWEVLDEGSCTAVTNQDCANEDAGCTWNQVATGPNYLIDTAGQYRLTLNYTGGCFNQFYFNVYTNLLTPTVTSRDIFCTTPGEIVVGGVPSGYEYSLDGTTYQASNTFSVTASGIYSVYIRQAGVSPNPCIFTVPDVQIRERDFTVSTIITQPLCSGDLGSVVLAANDVRPQYFFSIYDGATLVNSVGPIAQSDYTFSNLNPGTYTINVSTEDGCIFTDSIEIIAPPLLEATAALTAPLTCTDGEITVYPVGGTAPYYYFVNSTTAFQTNPVVVVTTPGVYDITVVDSNNCTVDTTITVDAIPAPEFTIATTDILCADGGNSGSININVTNANGNTLEYSIDDGVTFSNSSVFNGLATGNYDVVVQYTFGPDICVTDPQTVTINTATAITGTATLTTPYTCITDGVITVSGVSGGTAPYTYSLDGLTFQAGTTFSGLTNGTYTVTIQDANNCTFITAPITIDALNPPTDLDFSSTALSCPTLVSDVTITSTTGGTPSLEYQIIAPAASATAYQSSNVFSGLAPDTYTFQVRDANDCVYNETYTITALPTLTAVGQTTSDITCFGDIDGEAEFTVSGSTGFSYTINGGASTAGISPVSLTGLAAGTYTILVTDTATNCDTTTSITINEPSATLSMTTSVNPITCISNGSVVINATGGWGGNQYELTQPDSTILGPQGTNTFTNLSQIGTYIARVTDSNGCTVTENFDLITPTNPTATIAMTSDYCYDTVNDATLEVTASGGQTPYEYSINGSPFGASNIFNNLTPGSYTITVRDAFGCTVVLPAETIAPQLTINTVITEGLDCTATPDAEITGTISGGYPPYTYEISINGAAYTGLGVTGTPFTYTTATSGTFQFQITDSNNCTVESSVQTINPISPPEIISVVESQSILCNGDSNGAIDITINNTVGTPVFVINVNNDTTGTDYGTQTSGLPAGDYTITLTDSNSCTDTETITIAEPTPIVVTHHTVDITCGALGVSQGSIIIDGVTGGTSPYNYFVTGTNGYSATELNNAGTTSTTFNVIDFGLYQINVVDSNGCSILLQDVLVASPPTDLDITVNAAVDCTLGGEAVVSIGTSLVSSGPFFFDIYRGSIPPPPPGGTWIPEDAPLSQSATFTGLLPGVTYTFIVYDTSTDCSYYEPATVPIPTNSTLTTTALTSNNITCVGSADGNVSFTINSTYGVPTDVNYEIFDSLSLVTTGVTGTGTVPTGGSLSVTNLGPLPFGNYFVLIEEITGPNTGCSVITVPFNITESAFDLGITATVDNNANCNANSGVISAVATNGTAPYLYQITTSAVAPLATDLLWASASTFNVNANSYYVHVIDAYGCIRTTPVVVLAQDPEPVIVATVNNQCTAVEGGFEIDVTLPTAGIAPYSFSIDGGAFQTGTAPFTISNLSSGTHTVEVQDANGCGNLVSVDIESPIALTPTITALTSCLNNDGEITVNASGGSASYTYEITSPIVVGPQASNVFSGLASGTYTVSITDTNTLCSTDASITLSAATPVIFTTTPTDVTCNGSSDGTIIVNLPASNDNPIYTYEITAGPITVAPQNSNVFVGLGAGTYTMQVNSGRGCFNTEDVTINEPILLTTSGVATDFACAADNSVNTSTLTISEAGGTSPYTYSIDGTNYFTTNAFDIIDDGSIQNINIFVTDSNGCTATNTVVINPLPTITAALVAEATPIDCNNTGSIDITVTGGSGNFEYQMLPSGVPQVSNTFAITVPGDYYFQVNDLDTGCTFATLVYTVTPFDTIDAVATVTTDITCFGDNNGAFELNVTGYTGAYTYEVFDSASTSIFGVVAANTSTNPQVVSGMLAGSYSVVVTEAASPFCSTTTNVITIDSPIQALALVATETSNVTCDDNIGTITAVANGGWGTYEYELTGAATVAYSSNGTFSNLSAGSYTINVRDSGGCIVSDSVILNTPPPINATVAADTPMLSCFGDDNGSITISAVTGGQGSNYSYTLNTVLPTVSSSGPQSSNVFSDLVAGTYNITITDGYNCIFTSADVVIAEPTQVEADLVAASAPTCTTDASLTLSGNGGTGTYEYSDTASFATVLGTFATSTTITGITPGTYQYYIRDANGCIANVSNEITIDPLPALIANIDATNATINCAGDTTGVIVAAAEGGLGSYVYTLQDGAGVDIAPAPMQNTPGTFTDLPAGTYQVQVDSGDCLTTSSQVVITEPLTALSASSNVTPLTCNASNDGVIEIVASGGTGIIKYAISPQLNQFFDTPIFEDLPPGTYEAIAQDELGCFIYLTNIVVSEPTPVALSIVPGSILPEVCSGDLDGEFSVDISGGTLPYSVSLDDITGTYTTGTLTQTQFDFTALAGGDHVVYVRDAQGCESEWNITFPDSVLIDPMVEVDYGCTTNLSTNTVTVTVDASITNLADLDYSLNGGTYQTSNVFIDVPAGLGHYIDVRHTNGCIQRTDTFDITDFPPLTLVLVDGQINEIVANASGGSGDYEYTLNGESYGSTNTFIIYESGDYTVTVTDSNGCVATATRYFEYIDVCIPDYFTPNGDGIQDEWGPGCTNQYRDLTFDIFDRYGRKITTLNVGQTWDGKYKGKELPTGDYWYVVKLNDNRDDREFVGHFTLYR